MASKKFASKNDMVDVMVDILTDDGPKPLVNFRKTQKRMNGTQQFQKQNGSHRELHTHRSKNLVQAVNQHNQAYPRLQDQLKKRASLIKITTLKAHELDNIFDDHCVRCVQLATYNKLRKINLKPRCNSKRSLKAKHYSSRRRANKSRSTHSVHRGATRCNSTASRRNARNYKGITKTKNREYTRNRSYPTSEKVSKNTVQKSCQCSTKDSLVDRKFSRFSSSKNITIRDETEKIKDGNQNKDQDSHTTENKMLKDNDNPRRKAGSRHPSMSTLNSFGSMEHEPMEQ